MKKNVSIAAAIALALGGVSYSIAQNTDAPAGNAQPQGTVEKAEQGVRNTAAQVGIGSADKASEKMSPHAEAIHDTLAQVAEAAFSKNGVGDIVERFSKADRDRLNENKDAYKTDDATNGQIDQLAKDWKDKYGDSFDIKDEDKVYNMQFASIDEMGAGDAARTASGTVAPNSAATDDANHKAADANADASKMKGDAAVVHIAASHGLPAVDVPVVKEIMGWRIDAPESVDGAKLKANIQAALNDINGMKAQWPADQDEAYRHVTHRLLLAVLDKSATDAGGATGATGAAPSDTSTTPGSTGTTATPSGTPGATDSTATPSATPSATPAPGATPAPSDSTVK